MKNSAKATLFGSTFLLFVVIFFQWKDDMMFRFSSVVLIYYLGGLQYSDKKIQKINQLISVIVLLLVFILGFGFNYFKY